MSTDKPMIHEAAIVDSPNVGEGTRVWAFSHILKGARVGKDCNVCDHVFIENDVIVGDRVTIKCGVQLWDGLRIEDDVFIGPNVTFTNDPFPRSKQRPAAFAITVVGAGASIGANATILPGIAIGRGAMIGAGTVVTRDVPPNGLVVGNPGRLVRYVDAARSEVSASDRIEHKRNTDNRPDGVRWIVSPVIRDLRGDLLAREVGQDIPFEPKRIFTVSNVPSQKLRGAHAHRECHQLLICLAGSVTTLCDDGVRREEFVLESPQHGLYMPAMIWGSQFRYSADAVLMVIASHRYDADDYIRDYEEFLRLVRGSG
jgi:UDP-2-acetamido-3-amino-2,3-dideoxy-glucuronate N-acetyltransferase